MRDGHYNLFALVLLWWCWMLFREMESERNRDCVIEYSRAVTPKQAIA